MIQEHFFQNIKSGEKIAIKSLLREWKIQCLQILLCKNGTSRLLVKGMMQNYLQS